MIQVAEQNDLFAIGQLAAEFGITVRRIESAAQRLGMLAAMRLNRVPSFDGAHLEALRKQLSKQ